VRALLVAVVLLAGCSDYFLYGKPINRGDPRCWPEDPGVECYRTRHSSRVVCQCP
jgi:hypothetical protein